MTSRLPARTGRSVRAGAQSGEDCLVERSRDLNLMT